MATTRPYQGYPYKNPTITDVPSIDRSYADPWANLPRKPISPTPRPKVTIPETKTNNNEAETPDYVQDTILYNPFEDRKISIPNSPQTPRQEDRDSNSNDTRINIPQEINQYPSQRSREEGLNSNEDAPRIYIPIDNDSSNLFTSDDNNQTTQRLGEENPNTKDIPRIYIPIDNETSSQFTREQGTSSNQISRERPRNQYPINKDAPRIYIPIDNENSTQSTREQDSNSDDEEAPRIYVPPGPRDEVNGGPSRVTVPNFMSKEASIYQQADDGFPLSPIPVSEFPEPPPAYSEIDRVRPPPMIADSQPPRTQVIVPPRVADPPRTLSDDRQHLKCPHCDKQVNTVMLRESGVATHVAAWFLFFVFFPITIFIYCTDYCKYKNHYCPECSKLVGYEIPMTCQGFVFTEKSQ